jgi:hypothetical protein
MLSLGLNSVVSGSGGWLSVGVLRESVELETVSLGADPKRTQDYREYSMFQQVKVGPIRPTFLFQLITEWGITVDLEETAQVLTPDGPKRVFDLTQADRVVWTPPRAKIRVQNIFNLQDQKTGESLSQLQDPQEAVPLMSLLFLVQSVVLTSGLNIDRFSENPSVTFYNNLKILEPLQRTWFLFGIPAKLDRLNSALTVSLSQASCILERVGVKELTVLEPMEDNTRFVSQGIIGIRGLGKEPAVKLDLADRGLNISGLWISGQ